MSNHENLRFQGGEVPAIGTPRLQGYVKSEAGARETNPVSVGAVAAPAYHVSTFHPDPPFGPLTVTVVQDGVAPALGNPKLRCLNELLVLTETSSVVDAVSFYEDPCDPVFGRLFPPWTTKQLTATPVEDNDLRYAEWIQFDGVDAVQWLSAPCIGGGPDLSEYQPTGTLPLGQEVFDFPPDEHVAGEPFPDSLACTSGLTYDAGLYLTVWLRFFFPNAAWSPYLDEIEGLRNIQNGETIPFPASLPHRQSCYEKGGSSFFSVWPDLGNPTNVEIVVQAHMQSLGLTDWSVNHLVELTVRKL